MTASTSGKPANAKTRVFFSVFVVLIAVVLFGCFNNRLRPGGQFNRNISYGYFSDSRDDRGWGYHTIVVDSQTWMAENLRFETDDSWCYDDNSSYCAVFGRLYTWDAAMTACPAGWRLPDTSDWNTLARAVGGRREEVCYEGCFAMWAGVGRALKSARGLWRSGGNGTDQFGFSALPSGRRHFSDSRPIRSVAMGLSGQWWVAMEAGDNQAWGRGMRYTSNDLWEFESHKGHGYTVRCIKE
jgi:uncharacterized protein (TIGR02145 family)